MKRLLILLIFFISGQLVFAQTQAIKRFVKKMYFNKDSSKHSSFVIVPVLSSAPETGLEAGGTALYSFYTDTIGKNKTHVSNIFGYASITTKSQTNLTLNSTYWFPGNKFHLYGAISYLNFPFNFYGTGNGTRQADEDKLGQHRFKLNLEAETKLGDHLFLGIVGGGFDYTFSTANPAGIYTTDPLVEDKNGGPSIFAGPSVIFDTRNNNTYTTKGNIVTAYLNIMHGILANNNYQGGLFNIEYSGFFSLDKQLVLGLDVQEQSLIGGQSPFYLLPAMGSDGMMRGYYNGRFRDRNLLAGQTELRYRISKRFGIIGFAGTGEVFHSTFSTYDLKPNYGGGVRYFFDVQKGLSIRMDYGVGEKRPGEKRQTGLYVALGEAF
ncbi:MAG: polymerase [Sphingobacteriales bacterium]